MKYLKFIMTILFLVLTSIVSVNFSYAEKKEDKKITDVTIEEYNSNVEKLIHVSSKELRSLFDEEKTFIIYFGRETCPYCRKLSPTLKEFNSKINGTLFYYNTDGEDYDENTKLFVKEELGISTVPTTLSIVKGVPISGWTGDDATANDMYEKLYEPTLLPSTDTVESTQSNNTSGDKISDTTNLEYLSIILGFLNLLTSLLIIVFLLFKKH